MKKLDIKALWQAGQQQEAVKALVNVIEQHPDQVDNYLELAAFLTTLQDFEQAQQLLQQVQQRFPDNQDIQYSLATTYYAAGRYDLAEPLFLKLTDSRLKTDQNYMLGALYHQKQDDKRALAFALTAQQAAPQRLDATQLVGDIWLSLGQFKAAEQAYQQVLSQQPDVAAAYFNVGLALLGAGEDAAAYFKKADALDHDYFQQQQQRLADIERYLQAQKKQQ
ncbi:tetratricopeptide repeat protein [Loigolactobacillus bifermentans]|uniref:Uncharacterized protein n=1 Tax=Loigolactobacillus bifermentans DSM 20003 TaxID=1423726 RepID=A0A0R1GLY6_9LACO|nr:tetratricopeptide repeat protein [Loigolactobacillus bifermentans]KRK35126.1 hypothetical protein FC07_GL000242 [Loigolactobacillus bifermentans DSM 20003]QGG59213.1 tetratricopeptide repeat protein [Loigolactobacillus bifermentans]